MSSPALQSAALRVQVNETVDYPYPYQKPEPGKLPEFPIPFSQFSTKHLGGRPTKLTDELMMDLRCLIALTPIGKKHLCKLLGICHQTCLTWERQGEADRTHGLETAASEFLDLFEKGQAYWRARLMHAQLTGDKTWAKYATALERLWPEEFGRRQEDNGGPRVIVQFAVQASEVRFGLGPSPSVSPDIHRLSVEPEPNSEP